MKRRRRQKLKKKRQRQRERNRRAFFYRYRSLKDEKSNIRLVELLPGAWEEPIHCNLHIQNSRPFPRYEAISYCWGNPELTCDIICNGKILKITWNLRNALRQFRLPTSSRFLWADAICINQEDPKERGHQVMQMGTIFSEAEPVLIWLGRGTGIDVPAAFHLVRSLEPILEGLDDLNDVGDREQTKNFFDQYPRENWVELGRLLDYPWFERIWVAQEVGLAAKATLICGNATICWELFSKACSFLRYRLNLMHSLRIDFRTSSLHSVACMRQWGFNDWQHVHILNVLRRGQHFESTDPRDKVYALLGHPAFRKVCQELSLESFVTIEYTKSLFDTYLEVAQRLLDRRKPLRLLSFVYHTEDFEFDSEDSISWVPQWHSRTSRYINILGDFWDLYYASTPSVPSFSAEMRSISLRGTSTDQAINCFDVFSQPVAIAWKGVEFLTLFRPEVLVSIWLQVKETMGENKEEEIFKELCSTVNAGGVVRSEDGALPAVTASERLANLFAYFSAIGVSFSFNDDFRKSLPQHGDPLRFLDTTKFCANRRFFITKEGYMGLGPAVMKPGDLVCIFFGANTPFIIRKKPGTDSYWLCGECYVNGMMHGEEMTMLDEGKFKEEVFTLV